MNRKQLLLVGVLVALTAIVACARPDAALTAKVKAKLTMDGTVNASELDVTTHKKVVTLTGNLDSDIEKDRAIALARETEGVVDVVDHISVRTASGTGDAPEPSRSVGERIDDASITMAVKAKLLDDPQVKGLDIDVDTREGIVYLTGTVRTDEERSKAMQLARETEHVRDVQANLSIERG
jgi:hyperosmotically inducible protein